MQYQFQSTSALLPVLEVHLAPFPYPDPARVVAVDLTVELAELRPHSEADSPPQGLLSTPLAARHLASTPRAGTSSGASRPSPVRSWLASTPW